MNDNGRDTSDETRDTSAERRDTLPVTLVNGQAVDTITITDRGLQYGDGLFETIAVENGRLLCWQEHLARLNLGGERLHLPLPEPALLAREANQLCAGRDRAVLKLILTRGAGGRGYAPAPDPAVTRILSLHPWPQHPPEYRRNGVRVRLCQTRLGGNPLLAGIKHLNRLEQVLARGEWTDPEIAEGLVCDWQGRIIEGTMSNLFVVRGRVLLTPDLGQCGVAGVIRKQVLAAAKQLGLEARIESLLPNDLANADELFLCNSIIGLWPVRQLEQHAYSVGPVSHQIAEHLVEQALITRA